MCRWFEPAVADGMQWLELADEEAHWGAFVDPDADWRRLRRMPVRLLNHIDGMLLEPSDSPWFASCALVFRRRAREVLAPIVERDAAWCELTCEGADLQALVVRSSPVLHPSNTIPLDKEGRPRVFTGVVLRKGCEFGSRHVTRPS